MQALGLVRCPETGEAATDTIGHHHQSPRGRNEMVHTTGHYSSSHGKGQAAGTEQMTLQDTKSSGEHVHKTVI